ncbi:CZB domain-containing protein [Enterovibrio calviensis]|uniref:CZB domain-containing protein n=1 Tax=Enterovibrio calviensis TaxID=91359 RepID=UPI00047F79F4|nr:CZB domain-containing protein [Enterovibrio calviensis]
MSIRTEIDNAVGAHGAWKQKLRTAINTGECESTPDKVKQDNNCSFGKWLHHRIDGEHKRSDFYKEVVDLHAAFHREAGAILELALNGDKDTANERMKLGSQFAVLSANLTAKMRDWQKWLDERGIE